MKPLLASNLPDIRQARLPVMASVKLDGIRCAITPDGPVTRSLKPIRNKFVAEWLANFAPIGLDGELMVVDKSSRTGYATFSDVSSAIMSESGEPDFRYVVFDFVNGWSEASRQTEFAIRYSRLMTDIGTRETNYAGDIWRIIPLAQHCVSTVQQLEDFEASAVGIGYEGVMIRSHDSAYKYGRSTVGEGILLKIKRFEQSEAKVIGWEEEMHNTNELKPDRLNRPIRSTHKAGLVGKNTLGALICQTPDGIVFKIGSGFTAAQRQQLWSQIQGFRDACDVEDNESPAADHPVLGKTVTYRHQPSGALEAPRFPVFVGIRSEDDL